MLDLYKFLDVKIEALALLMVFWVQRLINGKKRKGSKCCSKCKFSVISPNEF